MKKTLINRTDVIIRKESSKENNFTANEEMNTC